MVFLQLDAGKRRMENRCKPSEVSMVFVKSLAGHGLGSDNQNIGLNFYCEACGQFRAVYLSVGDVICKACGLVIASFEEQLKRDDT